MSRLTLAEMLRKSDTFKTFASAASAAGVDNVFSGEDKYTVFMPSREVLNSLPEGGLMKFLKNHITKGCYDALDLEETDEITALSGLKLKIKEKNGDIYLNNVRISTEDLSAKNGMIHILDGVIKDD